MKAVGLSSPLTGAQGEGGEPKGGIDLEGIDVDAAPASVPLNMPLFDFRNFEGFTFQIIRIESIPNINVLFGIAVKEEEEGREKLAYLKN